MAQVYVRVLQVLDSEIKSDICSFLNKCMVPSGGSLVNLMEFCSKEMGKAFSSSGGGSADKNNRKSA